MNLNLKVLFFLLFLAVTGYAQVSDQVDSIAVPEIQSTAFYNYNFTHKSRLDSIQKTVPLHYNEYVQNFIAVYSQRKEMMGKMLGLSDYYFPIFEKALAAYHIPNEIKYLPIIESAMNPHAVSRVGATGLWQFMYGTAKAYGLNMDNFEDERKDPIQASYAAAAYFRDAYDELGDWLLAIAAYNCGKGNVTRAIQKSGSRDFWEIRPFLPKETRDYVPAFVAALYVMNYADKHEISVQNSKLNQKTDTIHVNHFVALTDIAKVLSLDEDLLTGLNPSYKKKIANGTAFSPKRIILPTVEHSKYAQLYEVLNSDIEIAREVIPAPTDDVRELRKKTTAKSANVTYKVKPGDTLSGIAEKFKGVTVAGIQKANGLKKVTIQPGMLLRIISR